MVPLQSRFAPHRQSTLQVLASNRFLFQPFSREQLQLFAYESDLITIRFHTSINKSQIRSASFSSFDVLLKFLYAGTDCPLFSLNQRITLSEGDQIQQENLFMICCKCRQPNGQMVCQECYRVIQGLRKQQKESSAQKKARVEQQISVSLSSDEVQKITEKMMLANRKTLLKAKIERMKEQNQHHRTAVAQKRSEITALQAEIARCQEILPLIAKQTEETRLRVAQIKEIRKSIEEKRKMLLDRLINHIETKFRVLVKYLAMDLIEPCKLEDWNQLMSSQSSYSEESSEEDHNEAIQISLLVQTGQDATQKMASHFARSIKAINLLASIHAVPLPFKAGCNSLRTNQSLLDLIYNSRGKFNIGFLRFYQANTIYLYSRACITVHHPDVEQGRLQQLHEALLNRLRGYSLNPISFGVRKPSAMPELQAESLGSILQEQRNREREKEHELLYLQEEDSLAEWIEKAALIGLKSVDSEDDIQILE